jgi:hypothetical protein
VRIIMHYYTLDKQSNTSAGVNLISGPLLSAATSSALPLLFLFLFLPPVHLRLEYTYSFDSIAF